MTLRVTIETVPYGDETLKETIFHLDINNTGDVRDMGFGNVVCSYDVLLYQHYNETMQSRGMPKFELEDELKLPEHNRRDGALSLVYKALALMED